MFDAYAPKTRMVAHKGGPLRSVENYQYGFYDIGPLRDLLDSDDPAINDIQISAIPIPMTTHEYNIIESIARHPRISYAVVDKDKIMFVRVGEKRGWLTALNEAGFKVSGGSKTPKRAKQLHRPTLLNAKFDHINVYIAESTQFSDYDFVNPNEEVPSWMQDPEITARLLDGAFVVSSRLHYKAIDNIPVYNPTNSTDPLDYYYDGRVRSEMIEDLKKQRAYNGRIIGSIGTIKGNYFVADLPEGIDVITSKENIKTELSNSESWYLIAEPQWAKPHASTDIQTLINFPKLFRKSDLEMWLREEYKKIFNDVTNGKILSDYKRIYKRLWQEDEEIDDQELHARMTYVGHRWVSMGFSVTNSPWLFKTLAISHAKPLQKRIPVPCALYEQIISESIAHMTGWDGTVEQGTIRRCTSLGVHIVNDLDWLEMYESHGGHDADDFFKLYYREVESGDLDGEKVIITNRCPNGYGEYSIFKYVENEPYPTWTMADGTEVTFPKINGRKWPTRLSEAIRGNYVVYTGLPSDNQKTKIEYSDEYSVDDFLMNVRNTMTTGNVGGYVNAVMLHSLTINQHRPIQMCSLESAIDGCTQTDVPEDRRAIDIESELIVKEVLESGKPIDQWYWETRGFANRYRDQDVTLYEGKTTQVAMLCKKYFAEYCKKVAEWAQDNARPVDAVAAIGERLVLHAQADIRRFRKEIYEANTAPTSSTGNIQRETWEILYDKISFHIDSFERDEDKHDYIIALLHSSIKFPTTDGIVTDQIVMNRTIYPYLERALIFYGLGSLLKLHKSTTGKLTVEDVAVSIWEHPDEDNIIHTFNDALDYQKFHQQFSTIRHTAPRLDSIKSDLRVLNIK